MCIVRRAGLNYKMLSCINRLCTGPNQGWPPSGVTGNKTVCKLDCELTKMMVCIVLWSRASSRTDKLYNMLCTTPSEG